MDPSQIIMQEGQSSDQPRRSNKRKGFQRDGDKDRSRQGKRPKQDCSRRGSILKHPTPPSERAKKRKSVAFYESEVDKVEKKRRLSDDQTPDKNLQISPVDRFNAPVIAKAPKYLKTAGYLKAKDGVSWGLPKVTVQFSLIRWRAPGQGSSLVEDGLPVSPGTIATFEQMNSIEREEHQTWEDEMFEAMMDKLNPDTMSPFYPGVLKAYGQRQIPWE